MGGVTEISGSVVILQWILPIFLVELNVEGNIWDNCVNSSDFGKSV